MRKKFEFCYLNHERRPTFAIIWDNDLLSACERLLFRFVAPSDLIPTPNGNFFIRGWETGETISVREVGDLEPSGTFTIGFTEEKPAVATPLPPDLGGLDLSQFAKQ